MHSTFNSTNAATLSIRFKLFQNIFSKPILCAFDWPSDGLLESGQLIMFLMRPAMACECETCAEQGNSPKRLMPFNLIWIWTCIIASKHAYTSVCAFAFAFAFATINISNGWMDRNENAAPSSHVCTKVRPTRSVRIKRNTFFLVCGKFPLLIKSCSMSWYAERRSAYGDRTQLFVSEWKM